MLKKELLISAKLDTGDFDKTVSDMQRKMKDVYGSQGAGSANIAQQERLSKAGLGPAPSQTQRQQADTQDRQKQRELDLHIRDQVKFQKEINKELAEKLKILKDIEKVESKSTEMAEKVKKTREDISRLKNQEMGTSNDINNSLNLRDSIRPSGFGRVAQGYQMGGFGGGARAFGREFMQSPGFAGSVVGGALAVAAAGSQVYANQVSMPRQILESSGSASAKGADRLGDLFEGRSAFENIFSPEQKEAAKIAAEEKRKSRISGRMSAGTSILGNAAMGAASGAAAGSLFFGAGAIPGALIGGAGGLIKGALDNMDQAGSGFGMFDNSFNKKIEGRLSNEEQSNRQSSLESLKNQSILRKKGAQYYEQNYMRDLGLQRQFGMDDSGLFDFFNDSGDFTRNQQISSAQGIAAAGGGTQQSKRLANTGNQMARDFNLTNSSQLLGMLSSGSTDTAASSNSIIKILAEGTRIGFDSSKNAEEMRKFAQITTEAITRSGANTSQASGEIAARMSDFVAGKTNMDVGNAQSAYQRYQGAASEGNGPRGAMQIAGMLKDPNLKKLSSDQAYSLQNMTPENIMAGGPEIEAMAQDAGLSLKDFQEKAIKNKDNSINLRASTDKTRESLRKRVVSDFGGDYNKAMEDSSFSMDAGRYMSASRTDRGALSKLTGRELQADLAGDISSRSSMGLSTQEAAVNTTRNADETNKQIAGGEKALNSAIQDMLGSFVDASKGAKQLAESLVRIYQEAEAKLKMPGANKEAIVSEANRQQNELMGIPGVQPTGGAPSK